MRSIIEKEFKSFSNPIIAFKSGTGTWGLQGVIKSIKTGI